MAPTTIEPLQLFNYKRTQRTIHRGSLVSLAKCLAIGGCCDEAKCHTYTNAHTNVQQTNAHDG